MHAEHLRTTALFAVIAVCLNGCALLTGNFRTVHEGRMYRSGQLTASALARHAERNRIRTVINLRTPNPDEAWYQNELRTCQTLGIAHHDIPWSKEVLPTPESLQRLAELYREGPHPILVHCQGGVHRAAVAAAVYLLLNGAPVDEAREQLGAFFNNAPIGKLLDLYEGATEPFEEWVSTVYPAIHEALKKP